MAPIKYTFTFVCLALLWMGCQDVNNSDKIFVDQNCQKPSSLRVFPQAFDSNSNLYSLEYIWDASETGANFDFRVFVNDEETPRFFIEEQNNNFVALTLGLMAEDEIRTEVRTRCGANEKSDWVGHRATYYEDDSRSTGTAVTIIPKTSSNHQSICDFVHCDGNVVTFSDSAVKMCDGSEKPLSAGKGAGNYFDRSAVCACLNAYPTLCEGMENLESCLNDSYLVWDVVDCL